MKRFKHMLSVMLVAVLFFSSFPSSEAASKAPLGSATVQVDKSPIFKTKSTKARKVLVLKKGTTVSLINEASGWIYVQQGRTKGYMQSKAFLPNQNKFVTKISSPVYVSASTKAKRVTTFRANTAVTVSKVFNSWVFVTSGKTSGWTAKTNLVVDVEKQSPSPVSQPSLGFATIQSDQVPVFVTKTTSGRHAMVLKKGVDVTVLSESSGWKYVQYGNTKGYIEAKHFVPSIPSFVTNKISMLYISTSTKSKRVDILPTNTDVEVTKVYRSWVYVTSEDASGWTAKSNLSVKETEVPEPTPPIDPEPEYLDPEFQQLVKSSYEKVSQTNEWQEPSAEVARLVNEYRVENGLNPLAHRQSLVEFAAFRWDDMKMNEYISHHSPTYGSFQEMTFKAGVGIHKFAGENISFNFMTPAQVVQGWKDSPPHNATMLSPDLTHSGVIWKDGIGVHIFEGDL